MRKYLFGSLVFLTFILLTSAAHAQKPVRGGSLTIAQAVEPPGMDPSTGVSTAIPRIVYSNVLEGLVKIDRNGQIVSALAKDYKISKDGKEYTFILNKDVKFHDGKPFDAEDVKFTLRG